MKNMPDTGSFRGFRVERGCRLCTTTDGCFARISAPDLSRGFRLGVSWRSTSCHRARRLRRTSVSCIIVARLYDVSFAPSQHFTQAKGNSLTRTGTPESPTRCSPLDGAQPIPTVPRRPRMFSEGGRGRGPMAPGRGRCRPFVALPLPCPATPVL